MTHPQQRFAHAQQHIPGGVNSPVRAFRGVGGEPIFIELPGWKESTVGAKSQDDLPENARRYLRKVEELCETPIDIISTGPDREETIILNHPFG